MTQMPREQPIGEKKSSHRQRAHFIADAVRADVLEGRLRPGEWVRQERIAREQGASQMPVREALRSLVAEGILEHVPYRGVRVVEFAVEDVEDLYACRLLVEGMSARYAASAITDDEVRELEDLHRRMLACQMPNELPQYRELNRRFHSLIFTASRRSFLIRTLGQLWSAFPTMLWSNIPHAATVSAPGRDEADEREHEAIVRALAARDPEAAEAAVRAHIDAAGRALLAVLEEVQGK
ncbi:MAG: GntR family transcriptional regulator [Acidobacteria bacterium]|nr:GntR family transcriptional regulator [Acidobacteriota bacterium]